MTAAKHYTAESVREDPYVAFFQLKNEPQAGAVLVTTPGNWRGPKGDGGPVFLVCPKCRQRKSVLHYLRMHVNTKGAATFEQGRLCHECSPPPPFALPRDRFGHLALRFGTLRNAIGEPIRLYDVRQTKDGRIVHHWADIKSRGIRLMVPATVVSEEENLILRLQPYRLRDRYRQGRT